MALSSCFEFLRMIKKLALLFMLSGSFFFSNAQDLELGVFGGVSYYNGDWNPALPYHQPEAAYGFLVRYAKTTRWAYRASFSTGTLASDNRFSRVNAAVPDAFSTKVSDLSVLVEFNFYDYFTGSQKDYATPYIFAGVSYFGTNKDRIQSIGFNRFSIPFGFGFKYSINKRLGVGLEWRTHKTFSDDLEENFTSLTNDYPDPNTNDWFNFTVVSLTYKFDLEKRQSCNSFENTRFE